MILHLYRADKISANLWQIDQKRSTNTEQCKRDHNKVNLGQDIEQQLYLTILWDSIQRWPLLNNLLLHLLIILSSFFINIFNQIIVHILVV